MQELQLLYIVIYIMNNWVVMRHQYCVIPHKTPFKSNTDHICPGG